MDLMSELQGELAASTLGLLTLIWTVLQSALQAAIIFVGLYYAFRVAAHHDRVGAPLNPLHRTAKADDDAAPASAVPQPK